MRYLVLMFVLIMQPVAQAQASSLPAFFAITHEVVNCTSSREERRRIEKPGFNITTEVCLLHVHCQSRLKANKKSKGPNLDTIARCWADKNNRCPGAQACVDDDRFEARDIKYLKKIAKPAAVSKKKISPSKSAH